MANVKEVQRPPQETAEIPAQESQTEEAAVDQTDPFAAVEGPQRVVQTWRLGGKPWEDHSPTIRKWVQEAYNKDAKTGSWYTVKLPNAELTKTAVIELRSACASHEPRWSCRIKQDDVPANTIQFKVYEYEQVTRGSKTVDE